MWACDIPAMWNFSLATGTCAQIVGYVLQILLLLLRGHGGRNDGFLPGHFGHGLGFLPFHPRSYGFGAQPLLLRRRGGRHARQGHAAADAKFVPGAYDVSARVAPPGPRAPGALLDGRLNGRLDAWPPHDVDNMASLISSLKDSTGIIVIDTPLTCRPPAHGIPENVYNRPKWPDSGVSL